MLRSSIRDRPERPLWLVTFADLIALLLAFFVMLFATQRVESLPWEALIDSLSRSLDVTRAGHKSEPSARRNIRQLSAQRAVDLGYLEKLLRGKAAVEPPLHDIRIRRGEDRLTMSVAFSISSRSATFRSPSPTGSTFMAIPILSRCAATRIRRTGSFRSRAHRRSPTSCAASAIATASPRSAMPTPGSTLSRGARLRRAPTRPRAGSMWSCGRPGRRPLHRRDRAGRRRKVGRRHAQTAASGALVRQRESGGGRSHRRIRGNLRRRRDRTAARCAEIGPIEGIGSAPASRHPDRRETLDCPRS